MRSALLAAGVAAVMALIPASPTGAGTAAGPARQDGATSSWQLVFRDDFIGTSIDEESWARYNGPGNGHSGPRARENVLVRDGELRLRTRKIDGVWHSAGVSNGRAVRQTYGKYLIRARFERGDGVRLAALLWPVSGWPPEVDFMEITARDADRTTNVIANHYRDGSGVHRVEHRRVSSDYTRWHTVGVEWAPDLLRYTLDGVTVATISDNVPRQPMKLAMQTALGSANLNARPNSTTPWKVDFVVDWVKIYKRTTG
jgi:beta-glucanase (GH16 family)